MISSGDFFWYDLMTSNAPAATDFYTKVVGWGGEEAGVDGGSYTVLTLDHGKGMGVLRGEIAAWLSQGRARDHVAAFATAREEDGGEGAVYVALRR